MADKTMDESSHDFVVNYSRKCARARFKITMINRTALNNAAFGVGIIC